MANGGFKACLAMKLGNVARFVSFAAATIVATSLWQDEAGAQICNLRCDPPAASSGSVYASGQSALFDIGSHFQNRLGALSSFRTAASAGNNPQGGGAEFSDERYRTWFEGYGGTSRTDASGDFLGDRRKLYGALAGAGMTIVPGATIGLSVDRNRTNIDAPGASGRIDLTQVGALAALENGPWTLGTTVVHGFGQVHSSRFDPGGTSAASYGARLWGAMGELSYYVALPENWRFVPKLTVDWLRTSTDAFTEAGGRSPVNGSSVTASRIRLLAGGEIGRSWLADRQIMDLSVYALLVDNLEQNIGELSISDATVGSPPQLIAGVRESTLGADAGATFSVKVTQVTRLYVVYDGRFRGNLTSHVGTVGAEFRW
jgi:uncharacterized protein with beta-barrel porin domain